MPPTQSPGPATYSLKTLVGFQNHDYNSLKKRGPQYSFGSQQKTGAENKSPGPAAFDILNFTRFGKTSTPAASMRQKHKELKLDANPGPTYNPTDASLYRFRYDPKFSMATRTKSLANFQTPGPNSKPTDLDVYKTRSPKYPMFQRNKELTSDRVPGPNAYDAAEGKAKVLKHNPAYSMRTKTPDLSKDKRPGPADYDLRFFLPFDKNPAYSLRRKHSEYAHVAIVPMDNC